MAANTSPRYTGQGRSNWDVALTTANTTKDMTSGTTSLVFTAPTDGALVDGVLAMPVGTNVQSVARVWINNGSSTGTAANNLMVAQATLPATTNSESAALVPIFIPIPSAFQDLQASYRIYVTIGTAVSAGWQFAAAASGWAS